MIQLLCQTLGRIIISDLKLLTHEIISSIFHNPNHEYKINKFYWVLRYYYFYPLHHLLFHLLFHAPLLPSSLYLFYITPPFYIQHSLSIKSYSIYFLFKYYQHHVDVYLNELYLYLLNDDKCG